MAHEQETPEGEEGLPETPPKRRRSPFRRVVLLALFALTLPFDWGERSSCQGGPRTFTGIDLFTDNPSNGIIDAFVFLAPVLLGLVQRPVRNAAARLLMELGAMVFASVATLYCFLNAVFSGGFPHSSGRVYLAPWIATLAPLLMLVDACQGAVERIRELLEARKRRRSVSTDQEAPRGSPEA
ncbi:hypothetical protein [Polyangium spumosum]|uniref:Uncharacterized protein n=1 Tax=Polyangium spumosum TaxID=889282 RepID=A0A6N7PY75_9BACT|nr:hypothetical protein [Polyangium spumosum]MRG93701.1 hypothetical protein [Polyangium spumosum]